MSSPALLPNTYYVHKCGPGAPRVIPIQDVENYPVAVPLGRDDVVLCVGFVHRDGSSGKGRYAKLLTHRGGEHDSVVLYIRVSKYDRSSLHFRELNPMLALALADKIPTL